MALPILYIFDKENCVTRNTYPEKYPFPRCICNIFV